MIATLDTSATHLKISATALVSPCVRSSCSGAEIDAGVIQRLSSVTAFTGSNLSPIAICTTVTKSSAALISGGFGSQVRNMMSNFPRVSKTGRTSGLTSPYS